MFCYAMKAAAGSNLQLDDRIRSFEKISKEPVIELFVSGFEELKDNNREKLVRNCLRFKNCAYLVHFPIFDVKNNYLYDAYNEEAERLIILLGFCREINSKALIMHRCYGFNQEIEKVVAEKAFWEKLTLWIETAKEKDVKLLIENYGFVWLPESLGGGYVTSPIDHFFPWDIVRFNENIKRNKLDNVGVILDIAHAVLSSNMFNMLKAYPELNSDKRFLNIYTDDLKKTDFLSPDDFIYDFIDYFHISDSFIWQPQDGLSNVDKFLCSEGMPIGKGNINYNKILKKISKEKTLVMEIEPENGDYNNNISQLEAIERLEFFASSGTV